MTQLLSNKQLLEGLLDESTIKKELVTELFGIGDSPEDKLRKKLSRINKELGILALDVETESSKPTDGSKLIFKAMSLLDKAAVDLFRSSEALPGAIVKGPGGKDKEIPGWKPSGEPGIHGGGFPFNPRKHV